MTSPDLKLERYATPTQWKYYIAVCENGSGRAAAKVLGVNKTTVINAVNRLKKAAARGGYAPDQNLTHEAAPGFGVAFATQHYHKGELTDEWIRTKPYQQDLDEIADAISNVFEKWEGTAKPVKEPKIADDQTLSAYIIGDPHVGLYCYDKEVGKNYDVDIATADHKAAIQLLVDTAPKSEIGLLCNLGDFFHADNFLSRTKSGHVLDTDGRFGRVFEKGVACLIEMVALCLKKHKKVVLFSVTGNHDEVSSLALAISVKMFFSNEPRLEVVDNQSRFLYKEWGRCLFGATHGDTTKMVNMGEVMAADMPEAWGRTKHRYIWTCHFHHLQKKEGRGFVAECFRTISVNDKYGHSAGHRAQQEAVRIDYNKDHGEYSRATMPIEMIRDLMKKS